MDVNTIIGKWELIAEGYYDRYNNDAIVIKPVENSESFINFFSNGKMKRPFFSDGEIIELEYPYYIDDQFLYENYTDEINIFIYKYKFDKDSLTLDCVHGNIPAIINPKLIHIYKRDNE